MTDSELLELAAKAAGIYKDALDCEWYDPHGYVRPDWNPLTDDGDALRLAVKLELTIYPPQPNTAQYNKAGCQDHTATIDILEPNSGNPEAATRRVIVRAAAAIGEQMK